MIRLLLFFSFIGLISSTVYVILVLEAARRFRRKLSAAHADSYPWPFVTILKPLHGLEPMLERNLESFFLQDYPQFEIIFGARHEEDPALKIVRALREKYPHIQASVVFSGEPEYPNAKIFSLEKMVRTARGSYWVITDSDVCVKPDCLKHVVRPLLDPAVGVVTCLYRGTPAGSLWSILEALGMSVEMSSGVLV